MQQTGGTPRKTPGKAGVRRGTKESPSQKAASKAAGGGTPNRNVKIELIHIIAWLIDFLHDASEGAEMIADFQTTFALYKEVWISTFGSLFPELEANLNFLQQFTETPSGFFTEAKKLLYKYKVNNGQFLFYTNQQG